MKCVEVYYTFKSSEQCERWNSFTKYADLLCVFFKTYYFCRVFFYPPSRWAETPGSGITLARYHCSWVSLPLQVSLRVSLWVSLQVLLWVSLWVSVYHSHAGITLGIYYFEYQFEYRHHSYWRYNFGYHLRYHFTISLTIAW